MGHANCVRLRASADNTAGMRAGLALAAAVACLWSTQFAAGQAPARLIVQGPLPAGVAERIAGQTADLPWSIELRTTTTTPSGHSAAVLAAEHRARAVLWVDEAPEGFVLHVFDAAQRSAIERRFPRSHAAGDVSQGRSAALESLALAVRSALQALNAEQNGGAAEASGPEKGAGRTGAPRASAAALLIR